MFTMGGFFNPAMIPVGVLALILMLSSDSEASKRVDEKPPALPPPTPPSPEPAWADPYELMPDVPAKPRPQQPITMPAEDIYLRPPTPTVPGGKIAVAPTPSGPRPVEFVPTPEGPRPLVASTTPPVERPSGALERPPMEHEVKHALDNMPSTPAGKTKLSEKLKDSFPDTSKELKKKADEQKKLEASAAKALEKAKACGRELRDNYGKYFGAGDFRAVLAQRGFDGLLAEWDALATAYSTFPEVPTMEECTRLKKMAEQMHDHWNEKNKQVTAKEKAKAKEVAETAAAVEKAKKCGRELKELYTKYFGSDFGKSIKEKGFDDLLTEWNGLAEVYAAYQYLPAGPTVGECNRVKKLAEAMHDHWNDKLKGVEKKKKEEQKKSEEQKKHAEAVLATKPAEKKSEKKKEEDDCPKGQRFGKECVRDRATAETLRDVQKANLAKLKDSDRDKLVQRALELRNPFALEEIATVLEKGGFPSDAGQVRLRASDLKDSGEPASKAPTAVAAKKPDDKETSAHLLEMNFAEKAKDLRDKGKLDEAREMLGKAYEVRNNPSFIYATATLEAKRGDFDKAKKFLEVYVKKEKDWGERTESERAENIANAKNALVKVAEMSQRPAEPQAQTQKPAKAQTSEKTLTPKEIKFAQDKALAAAKSGDKDKALDIASRIEKESGGSAAGKKAVSLIRTEVTGAVVYHSPFSTISDEQWSDFVESMTTGRLDTITPTYQLGMFGFGMKRLADFGLVENVRREQFHGKTVWVGDWKAPYSLKVFLSDPDLQYRTFVRDVARNTQSLDPETLSVRVGNRPSTSSGLLAVMKFTGPDVDKWLQSPADRMRFPATVAAYERANGIF